MPRRIVPSFSTVRSESKAGREGYITKIIRKGMDDLNRSDRCRKGTIKKENLVPHPPKQGKKEG